MNGVKDTSADKSIKYLYDENTNESVIKTNKGIPDSGTVMDEDKPKQAISIIPENNL